MDQNKDTPKQPFHLPSQPTTPGPAIKKIILNASENTKEHSEDTKGNEALEAQEPGAPSQPPVPSAGPGAPPEPVLLKKARITVKTNDDVETVHECLRNLTEIKKFIETNSGIPVKDTIKNIKIEVGFTDKRYQMMTDGTYDTVMKFITENIINANTAMEMVKHLCIRLVESSDLKCAMFTLIFDGARVGGIGIHNDTLPIDPMEIKAFLNAAGGQLDMYSTNMRQKYPTLHPENEKGRIIIP